MLKIPCTFLDILRDYAGVHVRTTVAVEPLIPGRGTVAMSRLGCPHRAVRTLKVVNGAYSLRARAASSPVERHTVSILRAAQAVVVIPHLRDLCAAVVQRSLARRGLVVPRAGAANVWRSAILSAKSCLEVG